MAGEGWTVDDDDDDDRTKLASEVTAKDMKSSLTQLPCVGTDR